MFDFPKLQISTLNFLVHFLEVSTRNPGQIIDLHYLLDNYNSVLVRANLCELWQN